MTNRREFLAQTMIGIGGACACSSAAFALDAASESVFAGKRFPYFKSESVPYLRVKMQDKFWAPRQEVTRKVSVPWVTSRHDKAGGLEAFKKNPHSYVADIPPGELEHIKFMEAMATVVGVQRDPAIVGMIDAWAKPLIAGQAKDGYFAASFPISNSRPAKRWDAKWWSHEDYTMGHYLEAALAYRESTGNDALYRSAVRAADNMADTFLGSNRAFTSGHPEIEQALMRLYGVTGNTRYLQLCGWLLDQRGHHEGRPSFGRYGQDHLPIKEQRTIEGHAVRAAFLFNGVTQYIGATGDAAYREAVLAIWQNLVDQKLYLHGAAGNISARNEGFRRNENCIMPDDVYGESCAVFANFQWAHSLARLTGEAHYLDTAERLAYNALYAALSLQGDSSFYCNVAQTDPSDLHTEHVKYPHRRSETMATSCCPPNIVKLFNKIGGYFYSTDKEGVYVNQYGAGEADIPWGAGVKLIQETDYPWDGDIGLTVRTRRSQSFTLRLRLPEWAKTHQLRVNGQALSLTPQNGWLTVNRHWKSGDKVELSLPMDVERVKMPPTFKEYIHRVALKRGPLVYCLEAQDLSEAPLYGTLSTLYLPQDAELTAEHRAELLGGVTVIKGEVRNVFGDFEAESEKALQAVFVPYGVWGNREVGAMRIWLNDTKTSMVEANKPQSEAGESCVS